MMQNQKHFTTEDLMMGDTEHLINVEPPTTKQYLEVQAPPNFNAGFEADEADLQGFDPNMTTLECFALVGKIAIPPIMGNMI